MAMSVIMFKSEDRRNQNAILALPVTSVVTSELDYRSLESSLGIDKPETLYSLQVRAYETEHWFEYADRDKRDHKAAELCQAIGLSNRDIKDFTGITVEDPSALLLA